MTSLAYTIGAPIVAKHLGRASLQGDARRVSDHPTRFRLGSRGCVASGERQCRRHRCLKQCGLLLWYQPDNVATMLPLFRGIDPDGCGHTTSCGVVTITSARRGARAATRMPCCGKPATTTLKSRNCAVKTW